MKSFCRDLKEFVIKITEKSGMIPLTDEEKESCSNQTICHICKSEFGEDDKKYYKVWYHCHYTGKYSGVTQYMQFKVQNTKIKSCGLVQQNKLWLLLLLIREVAKEFKGEIRCLDENTEK